jgi:hypothetical protein
VLYTGNSGTNAITGVGFQPDFVWAKSRTTAYPPELYDVIRGQNRMYSSATTADAIGSITSFDSDGFTHTSGSIGTNASGDSIVAWNWKAGGTAVSNTDGSITSSVSAAPDAGFSIATWTGTGSAGATVGHGLGAVPDVMIVKKRAGGTAYGWAVWHKDANDNSTDFLELNSTAAQADQDMWNDTDPTSTVLSLGANNYTNYPSGATYVGYFFKGIEGYSKFGTYVGNANADGTFVYTGFRPAWVMLKDKDSVSDWQMYDSERYAFNQNNVTQVLEANQGGAETTTINELDLLSNGFKLRSTNTFSNKSSNFIYLAFAEAPFKYANAR